MKLIVEENTVLVKPEPENAFKNFLCKGRRLAFVLLILSTLFIENRSHAQIVINEIGISASSSNMGLGGEFVELFNKSGCTVNIGCYILTYSGTSSFLGASGWSVTIPAGTMLGPGQYYLIGGHSSNFVFSPSWTNAPPGSTNTWINTYGTNGKDIADLDLGKAYTSGKSIIIGNLIDLAGQVTLFKSDGSVASSLSYNSGNNIGTYPVIPNSPSGCSLNPITDPGSSGTNITLPFSAFRTGLYLDASGIYQSSVDDPDPTSPDYFGTPGKPNSTNGISTQTTPAPLPTANAGTSKSITAGTPTSIGAPPVAGSTYSWTSTPSGFSSTSANPIVSPVITTTYYLTETDAYGCSSTNSVVLSMNACPTITVNAVTTNVLCFGASTGAINITASGGVTPYTYVWTGTGVNATSEDQTGLATGNYSVTVTDANACIGTANFIITQPAAALSASITSQTNVLCFGNSTGSVTILGAGGTSPYTYSKDGITFGASGTFNSLAAGPYTITVKDANGCTTTQAVTITQPAVALSASITPQTNVLCFGNSTGSVTILGAGGTSPYTYSKDGITFGASGTFNSLAAGPYTITVKDANGCTTTQAVTITQPAVALSASITSQTNVLCFGNSTGSVTILGAGGTSPYTYSKDGITFGASGTFNSLAAGPYTITVKDANGCTTTQAVTITQPAAALSASITSQTNVLCFGNSTGSVTVLGAGGTSPYTYSKDGITFVASGTFNSLAAGPYTITVKDANGCTTTQAVNIIQPAAISITSLTSNSPVCSGNTLTFSTTVIGGTAPLSYSWSGPNGFTSILQNPSITNVTISATGTYTLTVTDANSCTKTANTSVTVNPLPTVFNVTGGGNFCTGGTGVLIGLSGSQVGVNYQLKLGGVNTGSPVAGTGSAISFGNQTTTGTYTVVATNTTTGCAATMTGSVNVTISTAPIISTNLPTSYSTCAGTGVSFTVGTTGGSPAPTVQWQVSTDGGITWSNMTGETNTTLAFTPGANDDGNYYRAVFSNGCTVTTIPMQLIVGSPIGIKNPDGDPVSTTGCNGSPVAFSASANGKQQNMFVVWQISCGGAPFTDFTSGTVSNSFTGSGSGVFTSTLTFTPTISQNGCLFRAKFSNGGCAEVYTLPATLTVLPIPTATVALGGGGTVCAGNSVPVIFSGTPNAIVTYNINGGPSQTITLNGAGTATINLTSTSVVNLVSVQYPTSPSCPATVSGSVNITIYPLPAIVLSSPVTICNGSGTTLTANGASTYSWSPATGLSATTGSPVTASPTSTTTYSVTGTDANGCTNSSSVTVTVRPIPTATISGTTTVCQGSPNPVITFTNPQTIPVTITYNAGAGNQTINVGASGTATISQSTTNAGTFTYNLVSVVYQTAPTCSNNITGSVIITVNPATVIVTPPQPVIVCEGGSAIFTVVATGLNLQYQWQVNTTGNNYVNIGGATSSTYTITPVTTANATNYQVIITGTCGTVTSVPVALTVNPLPACNVSGTNVICQGQTTSFTATAGMSAYSWTGPGGFTATTQIINNISVAGVYTVTITNTNGCQSTCTRTLTVNPNPITIAPSAATICNGNSVTLTASGATTYTWSPSTSLSSTTGATVTASPTSTITYTVIGTTNGCTGTANVIVTVNPLPAAPTVTSNAICGPGVVNLSASGCAGGTLNWYTASSGGTLVNTGSTYSPNISSTTSYWVSCTDANGCISPRTQVTGTVNTIPSAPSGTGASRCGTGTVSLSASGCAGGTLKWYDAATSGTQVGTGSPFTTPSINATTSYWVSCTNAAGCEGPRTQVTATIVPFPNATISGSNSFCTGGNTVLTANPTGATSYQWQLNGSNISPGQGGTSNPYTATQAGSYTVTVTSNGCTATSPAFVVTINPLPTALISGTTTICSGSPATISVALTGTAPWSVTYTNGTTPVTVNGIISSPYSFSVSPTITTTYTLSAVNDANCTGTFSGSAIVTVNPIPSCSIAGNATVCSGNTANYTSTVTPSGGTVTHSWSITGSGTISGSTTGATVTVIANTVCAVSTFTLTDLAARNNCTTTCTYIVTVNPPPIAAFTSLPPNVTVACGSIPALSSLSYSNVSAGGSGTCLISGLVTSTQTAAPSPCGGTVTETWTFTDVCGRTITQNRIITVSPAALPTMTAPANMTVACGAIPSPSTLTYTNGLSGGCLITGTSNTSTFSATPSACGGTITETWTATDPCGRTIASVSRIITVSPAALPTMTAPANITVACGAIPVASTLTYTNGLSGGCLITGTSNTSTFSATPSACGGTVTETWTATDPCGRTITSVSRTITVNPAALPTMTAPANITVACGAIPAASTLTYTNGLSGGCLISGTSNPSTFSATPSACGGTVTETWTATDPCGRTITSVSRTITVSPAAIPAMTAPANITVACGTIPSPSTLTYTNGLTGGCLITGTSNPSTFSSTPSACGGTVTETWNATDACGRTITASRTITVTPAAAPTFTSPPANITVACGVIPAVSSLNYSNGSSGTCLISGSATSTQTAAPGPCGGIVTETWTATDACGRTITASRTITVTPAAAPTFTSPPANITVACGAIPAVSSLNYSNGSSGTCLISGSATSTQTAAPGPCGGIVTETWNATDACGRTITASRTITVTPAAAPTFTSPPANITVACGVIPAVSSLNYSNGSSGTCLISGSATSTQTAAPGPCGGTVTETWNATDACGRTITASRTITVTPAAAPTFTSPPANITVACGAIPAVSSLNYSNGSSGTCLISGSATSTQTAAPGPCGGIVTETWTATDACGRTITASRTITVTPAAAPTFTSPPANITVACGAIPAVSSLNYSNGSSGTCLISGSATSTQTAAPGPCGGIVTETWNATDACGRTITASRTITVTPAAAPTFTSPPANITVACGAIPAVSSLNYSNGSSGTCLISGSATSTQTAAPGPCGGTVTETWNATDACGRTITASRTITVTPAAAPTFTSPPANITVACGVIPAVSSLNYSNGSSGTCLISGSATSTQTAAPGPCGGIVTETWNATDACGRTITASRTITVTPAAAPTFTSPPANITVACGAIPAVSSLNYSNGSSGTCLISGSATSTQTAAPGPCGGIVTETWNATDACGRTITASRTITVTPAAAPTFTSPPSNITVACGAIPAVSSLNYSNGSSGTCLISGSATSTQTAAPGPCGGIVTETWNATDACGRTITASRTITVTPAAAPTFTSPPANITVACGVIPAVSSLNYSNGSSGTCLISGSATSTQTAAPGPCGGTVTETWNATDACGRTITASRTITVTPAAAPTFTSPPANITVACGAIPAVSSLNYSNGSSGTCLISGSATSTQTAAPGPCGGIVTETWTATDACGRTITASRTITVTPAAAPTFTSPPANITVACGAIPAVSSLNYSNGSSGTCLISGSATSTQTAAPGPCGGIVTETWNATDACGRTITASRTITVTPAAAPTFTSPPANITVACGVIPAVSSLNYSNGSSGTCLISGSATSTQTAAPGPCGGTVTETWNATDACGRTITASRTITVTPAAAPTFTSPPANITVACGAIPAVSSLNYSNGSSGTCLISGSATSTQTAAPGPCGGTVTETWTATDACGRTITASRTITVTPAAAPTFTSPPANITVACGAIPAVSSLNYSNGSSGTCLISGSATSTQTAAPGPCGGIVTETWNATDACGRTITASRTITVTPAAAPTFTSPPSNITVACGAIPAVSSLNYSNGSSGTCLISGSATSTQTAAPGPCGGIVTETWNATDACGRTITASRTITVTPCLRIPTFAPVAPICSGGVLSPLPTTSNEGLTGTWLPALNNTTTTTYTFTPTTGQCATTTTLTITVNPILSATINCGVSTTTAVTFNWAAVSGAVGYSVSYQINAGPSVNVGAIGNVLSYQVTGLTGGDNVTITVTPTGTGCFTAATATCTATACTPPTANISYATPFCADLTTLQTVTLTGTGAFTGGAYSASPAGLTINTTTGAITPSTSTPGAYTVTYIVAASGGCPGVTATTSVTIAPVITPTFNPVTAICSGATPLPLPTTSLNGINGSWSPALNNTTTTTYTFTPTTGQCATTTTLTITVNPNVTPTFNPVAFICSGATLAPLPTTSLNGITGSWSPALNNTTTTTYTFTPTIGQCATTTTLIITVNPNVTPTFNPVTAICSGATLAPLTTTSLNNITGTWSPALNNTTTTIYTFSPTIGQCATTTTLTITVNPNITPTFNPVTAICSGATLAPLPTTSLNNITGTWSPALNNTTTTTYTFTPTIGQCATTTILTITVNSNVTPTFNPVTAICSGATLAPLPTTSFNGITGTWSPVLNNTTTTTYTFTPTIGQCATTITLTITVNPILSPVINCGVSSTTAVTFNWAAVSGATGYSVSYQVNSGAVVNAGAIGNLLSYQVTGLTGGDNVTITVTPTGTGCFAAATATCTATACTPPTANISYATPFCADITTLQTVTLTGTGAFTGGAYSASPAGLTINPITGAITPSTSTPGAYTVTYTVAASGGCPGVIATTPVTINPIIIPTFNPVAAICSGVTLTPLPTTSLNNITGTWSPALNNTTTTIYTFNPAPGQCATTTTLTITVNPNIIPTFNPVAAICSGATLTPLPTTSLNNITGTWSPALNNTTTTIYTFNPASGQCATATTLTITVNPILSPVINCGVSSTAAVTFNWAAIGGASGYSVSYQVNSGAAVNVGAIGNLLSYQVTGLTGGDNVTITVTPTGTGCFAAATATCTATACTPPTANISYATPFCADLTTLQTVILTGTGAFTGGAYSASPAGLTINPATGAITPSTSTPGAYTVTYTVAASGGCLGVIATTPVTINPIIIPTFNPVAAICSGVTLTPLPTTSLNNITGTWSPSLNNTTTTIYTFNPAPGQCATTTTLTITVNPILSPVINCGVSSTTAVTFNWAAVSGATGYSVSYQVNSGAVVNAGAIGNLLSYQVTGLTGGDNVTITVTPTGTGCFAAATATCTATACTPPTANISYATPFCADITTLQTVTLTGTGAFTGGAYSASPAGLTINPITGAITPSTSTPGAYTVTYTVAASGGCPGVIATTPVTINPIIIPTFNPVAAICSGVTLTPLPTTSLNNITGTWSPALNNTTTTIYTFNPAPGQCATTTTLTITVNPNIIPTFNPVAAICSGATLTPLPTTSLNNITGTWSPALNNTTTTIYTFNPASGQCATATTLTITVNPILSPVINCGVSSTAAVTFNWAAIGGASGYSVSYQVNSGAAVNVGAIGNLLSYQVTGLTGGDNVTITVTPTGTGCFAAATATCTATACTPPTANISYATPFCADLTTLQTVILTGTGAFTGGAYSASPAGLTINPATGAITPSTSTPGAYTVTYTVAASGGCLGVIATTPVTINPIIIPTFNPVAAICSGVTLTPLPTTSLNNITGTWSPSLNNTTTTIYTFNPAPGQCATTTTLTITVNPILSPVINCGVSSTTAVTFNWAAVSGATGYSVSYQVNSGAAVNAGAIGNLLSYQVTGLTGGDNVIIAVTPTGTGCFTAATATCTATACTPPTANISYATPFCADLTTLQTVTLTGTGAFTDGAYSASPAGLTINPITGAITPSTSTPGAYTVTYTVTASGGCPGVIATTPVTINPIIIPTFNPVAAICSGATLTPLPTTSLNNITGAWSPALNNTTTTIYTFNPAPGQCATSTTLTITVNPNIIPTFNPVAAICSGATLTPLPTTSLNNITGTWSPALNNTTTTIYTFNPASGQCATATTLTITVNPILSPVINCGVSSTAAVTFNWAAVSGASGYSVSYQINAGPSVNVGTIGNVLSYQVTGLTSGDNVSITVTPTGAGCFAASTATCTATACTPPTANISYATPFCADLTTLQTVTLTGTGAFIGGAYSASPAGLTINPATGAITPSTSTPGAYTVTYTVAASGGCPGVIATTPVMINPIIIPTFNPVAAICSGVTLTPLPSTSLNNITGTWSPALNNTITTTYTFTPTIGQCATITTLTITVNPILSPVINCGVSSTAAVTFNWAAVSGASGYSVSYQVNAGSAVNVGAIGNVLSYQVTGLTGGDNVTITVTPTGAGCFTAATATCTTTTNASCTPPTANVSYATPFCADLTTLQTVTLTGTGAFIGGAYSASPAGLTINPATGAITPSTSTPGVYTVTYTVAASGGCPGVIATTPVTINPIIIPTFNPVAAICSGVTLTPLPTTSLNNITGTWSPALNNTTTTIYTFNPAAGQCAAPVTMTITVNNGTSSEFTDAACFLYNLPWGNIVTTSGDYVHTYQTINGCDSIVTAHITINNEPNVTTNATVCVSQLPFVWNGNSYNAPGTYSLNLQNATGCNFIATLILKINTITRSTTNTTICSSQLPFSWNGNTYTAAGSYSVTIQNIASCDSIAELNLNVTDTITSVTRDSTCINQPYVWNGNSYTTSGTYSVNLTNTAGCDSIATLILTVKPIPKIEVKDPPAVCEPLTVDLTAPLITAGSDAGLSYTYWMDSLATIPLANPNAVNVSGIYYIKAQDVNNCTSTKPVKITVSIYKLIAGLRYPTIITQKNKSTQLTARSIGNVYTWLPPIGLNSSFIKDPVFNYDRETEYRINITIDNGCITVDTVLVKIIPEIPPVVSDLFVPKAWTPNNDGHNDKLFPITVSIRELKYFRVYNRWGQLVFETNIIGEGWNGILQGKPALMDVYTWTVEAIGVDGKHIKKTGNSVLIR